MTIVVRTAVPGDADAIARVHVDTWREAYAGIVPQAILDGLSTERRAGFWGERIAAAGDERVWVAESDENVVGFASTGPSRDEDLAADAGELYAIYVAPEAWGVGAGHALFDQAVADLLERGFEPLMLWVLTDNLRGRAFYERQGWQSDGEARDLEFDGAPIEEIRYRSARTAE